MWQELLAGLGAGAQAALPAYMSIQQNNRQDEALEQRAELAREQQLNKIYETLLRTQGNLNVAGVRGDTARDVATIGADSRRDVATTRAGASMYGADRRLEAAQHGNQTRLDIASQSDATRRRGQDLNFSLGRTRNDLTERGQTLNFSLGSERNALTARDQNMDFDRSVFNDILDFYRPSGAAQREPFIPPAATGPAPGANPNPVPQGPPLPIPIPTRPDSTTTSPVAPPPKLPLSLRPSAESAPTPAPRPSGSKPPAQGARSVTVGQRVRLKDGRVVTVSKVNDDGTFEFK